MKIILLSIILFLNTSVVFSQETNLVKYFNGFALNEGIYLGFLNFKQNAPLPKANILTNINPNSFYYYDLLIQNEYIFILTESNDTIKVATNAIWGYSENGVVYIQLNGLFSRIHQVGALSHFMGKKIVIENNYVNSNSGYWGTPMNQQKTHQEVQEFILDFESGNFSEFSIKTLETLLKRDQTLYDEYIALNSKKKRQLMYFYLKKYNKRHPIYFPI